MSDTTHTPPGDARRAWWVALLAGLAYAWVSLLASPWVGLWWAALIAPAPLLWLAARSTNGRRDALWASVGALPLWGVTHWWVTNASALGWAPLTIYLTLYTGMFVWIGAALRSRLGAASWRFWCALPVVWVGLEVLRGEVVFDGYPWHLAAHPLIEMEGLARVASFAGAYAVCLLSVAFAACAAFSVASDRRPTLRRVAPLGAALLALGVVETSLRLAPRAAPGEPLRIAVVQTNVPQGAKLTPTYEQTTSDFVRMVELTLDARDRHDAGAPADVYIWPETMFPGIALDDESARTEERAHLAFPDGVTSMVFRDATLRLSESLAPGALLVGAIGFEGLRFTVDEDGVVDREADARFNSAFLLRDGRVTPQRYDKTHLTPFGEVMPYISRSKWLEARLLAIGAQGMTFDLKPGREARTIDLGARGVSLATPICFEATMSRVVRRLVFERGERRAHLVVNLTNDGWFGGSRAGRRAHLQASRWRAVETGTPVVRAANTGVSCVIDARGRVLAQGPDGADADWSVDGVLLAEVPTAKPGSRTLHALVGDSIGWACLALTILAVAAMLVPAARRRIERRDTAGRTGADDEPTT